MSLLPTLTTAVTASYASTPKGLPAFDLNTDLPHLTDILNKISTISDIEKHVCDCELGIQPYNIPFRANYSVNCKLKCIL